MSELGKLRLAQIRENWRHQRQEIWLQFVAGAGVKELAQKYGVTKQAIQNRLNRAEKEQYAGPKEN